MLEKFIGNDALRNDLLSALQAQHLPSAILLCGEKGLGKGYMAQLLAADYLYPQGGAGAQAVLESKSPECLEVEGEGASGQISVRRIREVRSEIMGTALSAAGRAVIIYEAQNMNGASANALLKILEEPPENVVFILTAPGAAAVMATIRSRCAAYNLTSPAREEGIAFLKEAGAEKDAAFYYDVYGGKVGLGLACIRDEERRAFLEDAKKLAEFAAGENAYGLNSLLSHYEKDKTTAGTVLQDAAQVLAAELTGAAIPPQQYETVSRAVRSLTDTALSLRRGGNPKLMLTALAIRLSAHSRQTQIV